MDVLVPTWDAFVEARDAFVISGAVNPAGYLVLTKANTEEINAGQVTFGREGLDGNSSVSNVTPMGDGVPRVFALPISASPALYGGVTRNADGSFSVSVPGMYRLGYSVHATVNSSVTLIEGFENFSVSFGVSEVGRETLWRYRSRRVLDKSKYDESISQYGMSRVDFFEPGMNYYLEGSYTREGTDVSSLSVTVAFNVLRVSL